MALAVRQRTLSCRNQVSLCKDFQTAWTPSMSTKLESSGMVEADAAPRVPTFAFFGGGGCVERDTSSHPSSSALFAEGIAVVAFISPTPTAFNFSVGSGCAARYSCRNVSRIWWRGRSGSALKAVAILTSNSTASFPVSKSSCTSCTVARPPSDTSTTLAHDRP